MTTHLRFRTQLNKLMFVLYLKPRSRLKKLLALLLGSAVGAAIFFAGTKTMAHHRKKIADDAAAEVVTQNERVSPQFRTPWMVSHGYSPHHLFRSVRRIKGQLIFDMVFGFDEFNRRFTPPAPKVPAARYALFLGCSFVFGDGVNDEDTIPALFQSRVPNIQAYNYGQCGASPIEMLQLLTTRDFSAEVPERQGILVYMYIDGHIERAVETPPERPPDRPYYSLKPDGTLDFSATYANPPLEPSNFRALFADEKRQTELTARLIEECVRVFRRRLDSPWFVFVVYPGSRRASPIIDNLTKAGVPCLDYSTLFDPHADPQYTIHRLDSHPSPEANRLLVDKLVADLKQLGAI